MRAISATLTLVAALTVAAASNTAEAQRTTPTEPAKSGRVSANGIDYYYEIHGSGEPVLLLHGGLGSMDMFDDNVLPALAKTRQVIVVELQGHGRTADIDRPLSTPLMADDIHALMGQLKIGSADVYGYSMGGGVAFQLALRHPERVRKLVIAGAAITKEGVQPGTIEMIKKIEPSMLEGSPFAAAYRKTSPHPEKFPTLVAKV